MPHHGLSYAVSAEGSCFEAAVVRIELKHGHEVDNLFAFIRACDSDERGSVCRLQQMSR